MGKTIVVPLKYASAFTALVDAINDKTPPKPIKRRTFLDVKTLARIKTVAESVKYWRKQSRNLCNKINKQMDWIEDKLDNGILLPADESWLSKEYDRLEALLLSIDVFGDDS